MKSSKQIKIEFWKRKLKEYIESIKKNSLEKTNLQMPKNWSLSKKLSDTITIFVSNKQCDDLYSFFIAGAGTNFITQTAIILLSAFLTNFMKTLKKTMLFYKEK